MFLEVMNGSSFELISDLIAKAHKSCLELLRKDRVDWPPGVPRADAAKVRCNQTAGRLAPRMVLQTLAWWSENGHTERSDL